MALLFGIVLLPGYLFEVKNKPDYVGDMIRNNLIALDEFNNNELDRNIKPDCRLT